MDKLKKKKTNNREDSGREKTVLVHADANVYVGVHSVNMWRIERTHLQIPKLINTPIASACQFSCRGGRL